MSDETVLRDRIEKIIEDEADADGYGGYSSRRQAQAIIDDLEITTEDMWTTFPIDDPKHLQRVVGKWEET